MKYLIILTILIISCTPRPKPEPQRLWQKQLEQGKITKKEYEFLLEAQKDLKQIKEITE